MSAFVSFIHRAPVTLLGYLLHTMDFQGSRLLLQTFRNLRWIAEELVEDSYCDALDSEGLKDNPCCPANTFSKYRLLLQRRRGWTTLEPYYTSSLQNLPWVLTPSQRVFSGGHNMLFCTANSRECIEGETPGPGSSGTIRIRSSYLPSDNIRWMWTDFTVLHSRFHDTYSFIGKSQIMIIGAGVSIEEHDMVIFAVLFKENANDEKSSVSLSIRQNVTGIFISGISDAEIVDVPLFDNEISWSFGDNTQPEPHVELLVGERYVLIATENHGGNEGYAAKILLSILDVTTKEFVMVHTWVDSSGLAFLDENTFINPNLQCGALDVYFIDSLPSNEPNDERVVLRFRFGLPELEPGNYFGSISCQCSPVTTKDQYKRPGSRVPFFDDPSKAIIHIGLSVRPKRRFGGLPAQDFTMIVHRSALLELTNMFKTKSQQSEVEIELCPSIPWEEWGPNVTRWFRRHCDGTSTNQSECTYGQRYVEREHNSIFLMDFNPKVVEETLRSREDHKGPVSTPRGCISSVISGDPPQRDCRNVDVDFGLVGAYNRTIEEQEDISNVLECRHYFHENIVNRLPYIRYVHVGGAWSLINICDMFFDGLRFIIVTKDNNGDRYVRTAFFG